MLDQVWLRHDSRACSCMGSTSSILDRVFFFLILWGLCGENGNSYCRWLAARSIRELKACCIVCGS